MAVLASRKALQNAGQVAAQNRLQAVLRFLREHDVPAEHIKSASRHMEERWLLNQDADVWLTYAHLPEGIQHTLLPEMSARLLQQCPLFYKLSASTLSFLATRLRVVVALQDTCILRAGDISHSLYFIKRGIVQLEKLGGEPFARLSGGAYFGAMHVVLEQRLLFSAISGTDCELLVLSREDLNEAARQSPEFFCILQSLGKSSALRGMLREGVDSTPQVQRWSSSSNKLHGDRLRSDPHVQQPSFCGSILPSMVRGLAS